MATALSHTSGKNLICWVLPPDLARPTERAGGSGGLGFLASLMGAGPQGHSLTLGLEPSAQAQAGVEEGAERVINRGFLSSTHPPSC